MPFFTSSLLAPPRRKPTANLHEERIRTSMAITPTHRALVGERLRFHNFAPLGSPPVYCRTTDRSELRRLTCQQLKERGDKQTG
jgi:hypothetical protein